MISGVGRHQNRADRQSKRTSSMVMRSGVYVERMEVDRPRIRVIDLETAAPAWTTYARSGGKTCVRTETRFGGSTASSAILVKSGRPMSLDTMAVHHILDEHVANATLARNCSRGAPPGGRRLSSGSASSAIRATLLPAKSHRRRRLDLHLEMRAAPRRTKVAEERTRGPQVKVYGVLRNG